jgi:hypothetical protein
MPAGRTKIRGLRCGSKRLPDVAGGSPPYGRAIGQQDIRRTVATLSYQVADVLDAHAAGAEDGYEGVP